MTSYVREVWVLEYSLDAADGERQWIVDKAFERASAAYRTLERLSIDMDVDGQQFRVVRYVPYDAK